MLILAGALVARKIMKNNKMKMVLYERQKSEMMDEDVKVIEMSKIKGN